MDTVLLSTAYFAPVQWYQKLQCHTECLIECHDNFLKQTYRNRCVIATTQGQQALTVPVERPANGRLDKTPMCDIKISNHGNWRHLHWNALASAYGESPFFEYYQDDLRPFFERRWEYLIDFNLAITDTVCRLLDVHPRLSLTERYLSASEAASAGIADFRDVIRPKHPGEDPSFTPRPYYQVYQQKYGFLPNLSILDLLFNEGNEAIFWLMCHK